MLQVLVICILSDRLRAAPINEWILADQTRRRLGQGVFGTACTDS